MKLLQSLLTLILLAALAAIPGRAQNVNELAAIADKEIWFLGPGTFEERILNAKQGIWLVAFGTRWCPYCKKLAPNWLKVQKQVEEEKLFNKLFSMAKVDCTDVGVWCNGLKVKGYPNVFLYHNGEYVDEYLGQHDPDSIMSYIKQKMALYEQTDKAALEAPKQPPQAVEARDEAAAAKAPPNPSPTVVAPKVAPLIIPPENQPFKKEKNAASPVVAAASPQPNNESPSEKPVNVPAKPADAPVKPTDVPQKPEDNAQKPADVPVQPPSAPTKPAENAPPPAPPLSPNPTTSSATSETTAEPVENDGMEHTPIKGVSRHPRKEFRGFRGFIQSRLVTPLVGPEFLGIGLVAGGAVIKLPQIFKIFMKRSAQGVSFASYALETAAYIAGLAYNVRRGNPFNTYGEHAFMAVANCVVIGMMFHYTYRHKDLFIVGSLTFIFTVSLFSPAIINDTILLSFQWIAILIGVVSKVPQIHSNWANQSCGQLSAVTVGLQTVGSLARCFTTATEVKDTVIFVTYLVATGLNGTVLYQVVIYWGKKRKSKSLLD